MISYILCTETGHWVARMHTPSGFTFMLTRERELAHEFNGEEDKDVDMRLHVRVSRVFVAYPEDQCPF